MTKPSHGCHSARESVPLSMSQALRSNRHGLLLRQGIPCQAGCTAAYGWRIGFGLIMGSHECAGIWPLRCHNHGASPRMKERENGILTSSPSGFISMALRQQPPREEATEDQRSVDIEVPGFGMVRFCCQRYRYRRHKSSHWAWRCDHAAVVGKR